MSDFRGIKCWKCGVRYGLEEATYLHLKQSGAGFSCPFGHGAAFNKTPVEDENDRIRHERDEMRRERDRLTQRVAQKDDEIRTAWATAEDQRRRSSAARGQVTKLKNRAANGVCPCCSRSFSDLRRHMATKHAGFLAEDVQGQHGTIQ